MIRYKICPANSGATDVYDDEKVLFCESCHREYYKS